MARKEGRRKAPGKAVGHRDRPQLELVHDAGRRPDMPDLSPKPLKVTVERWEAFWGSEVSRAVDLLCDRGALDRWITYLDEWERSMRAFRRNRIVRGSTGQPTLNPLSKWIASLEASIVKAEMQFGMNPDARVKLGINLNEAALTAQRINAMLDDNDDLTAIDAGEYVDADAEELER